MKAKKVIGFAVLAVAIAGGFAAIRMCNADVDVTDRPMSQLVDKENRPVDLGDFKGKVVLVNNWASWCPPCIAEMRSIQQLKNELNPEEVVFVMVSFDEDPDKAKNFIKKQGYDLELYFPGKSYPYSTSSIPVTFVLDKQGKLVMQHEGMLDYKNGKFVKELRTLIE